MRAYREEKCDVILPWYQNFWIATIRSLSIDDGDGNENGEKAIGLDWQNNNVARASRFFVHLLAIVARLRHETSNFVGPLYGVHEDNTKFSFSFSKLRYDPFGFNPRKFRQHFRQIK